MMFHIYLVQDDTHIRLMDDHVAGRWIESHADDSKAARVVALLF